MLDFKVNTSIEEKENLPVSEASLEANAFITKVDREAYRAFDVFTCLCLECFPKSFVYIFFQLAKWLLREFGDFGFALWL